MKTVASAFAVVAVALLLGPNEVFAATESFDQVKPGQLPSGWSCGVTGKGSPKWDVIADPAASSKPQVLKQSGQGNFPWCAKTDVSIQDGFVEVRFKPLSGAEDQAGGVVWRFKDGNNYYIARGNALENNVSLYYTENGKRKTLRYVDASITLQEWNTLRVEFAGKAIKVLLNGKAYIELEDDHIQGAGGVGVWTKADSVTAFDDFSFAATTAKKPQ
jgi:hypothetical protein